MLVARPRDAPHVSHKLDERGAARGEDGGRRQQSARQRRPLFEALCAAHPSAGAQADARAADSRQRRLCRRRQRSAWLVGDNRDARRQHGQRRARPTLSPLFAAVDAHTLAAAAFAAAAVAFAFAVGCGDRRHEIVMSRRKRKRRFNAPTGICTTSRQPKHSRAGIDVTIKQVFYLCDRVC